MNTFTCHSASPNLNILKAQNIIDITEGFQTHPQTHLWPTLLRGDYYHKLGAPHF